LIFQKLPFSAISIRKNAIFCAVEFTSLGLNLSMSDKNSAPPYKPIFWEKPDKDFYKMNTDGSAKLNHISAGGILRDENGNFVAGFSEFIGYGHSLKAELWTIFRGIELAASLNIKKIILESDCTAAINCVLSDKITQQHPLYALIFNCKNLLCFFDSWCMRHTLREANSCADFLANHGRRKQLQHTTYISLPPFFFGKTE